MCVQKLGHPQHPKLGNRQCLHHHHYYVCMYVLLFMYYPGPQDSKLGYRQCLHQDLMRQRLRTLRLSLTKTGLHHRHAKKVQTKHKTNTYQRKKYKKVLAKTDKNKYKQNKTVPYKRKTYTNKHIAPRHRKVWHTVGWHRTTKTSNLLTTIFN